MRRTLTLLTFAGLSISVAQTPQIVPGSAEPKPKKEEFRNKAPVSKEVLRVRLPKAVETHLDNGLTVLVLEDHRLPQIAMALELRGAGGLYDPPSMTGLAAMTAQMLREGTATRNSRQISEQLDLLAASMFGAAGSNSPQTVLNLSGLSDN